jgi:cell wall-associated NlpC family hydrolase
VVIPLHRQVKLGSKGPDVLAVKRALNRKGFGAGVSTKGPLRKWFGPVAATQLYKFRKAYKIKPTRVYDKTAHRTMVYCGGFDRWGAYLMGLAPIKQSVQQKIVATAFFGRDHASQIHYTQGARRMGGVRNRIKPPRVPSYEDCSSFATWCYWVAGAPDPNGLGYDGYGYTGTQVNRGRKVSTARPGDLVFYGNVGGSVPTHVAICVGGGKVVSHGGESGPLLALISYRRDLHSIRRYV